MWRIFIMTEDNSLKMCKCKLCCNNFLDTDMSEEHYPAKSVGNDDIVALDLIKTFDSIQSEDLRNEVLNRLENGEDLIKIADDIFDNRLSTTLYPKGRTARTLCKKCNTFLGKYDESYKRFFEVDGNPKVIKGFQTKTKFEIIKAIYAKFLSIPETFDEHFDFINFVRNEKLNEYDGKWNLYFIKRDYSTDLLGLCDLGTGKETFDEGVVYELSDDKFIFNLMNFKKHDRFEMTNIFDILKKDYKIIEGVGEAGGYHGQIMMCRLLSEGLKDKDF